MKPNARHRARECAVQAIYSWQLSQNNITDIEALFLTEQDMKGVDTRYFRDLIYGVVRNYHDLDALMAPYLTERRVNELGQIEKAVLRLSLFELTKREDVPFKVVINEAIELTKEFGAEESHKFVNGVLDKIAPTLRKH